MSYRKLLQKGTGIKSSSEKHSWTPFILMAGIVASLVIMTAVILSTTHPVVGNPEANAEANAEANSIARTTNTVTLTAKVLPSPGASSH